MRCETVDLEVPADVDFVLEGYVQPGETRPEGPFGDHTGFYTPVDDYPVFHLTAITHRKDAIYPATIVGVPPMEDYYIGDASVRVFLPVMKMNFPEIVDLTLPPEGFFTTLVFVSIRKQYPFQAYKIMHGLWGMGQMMFSKYIVVVDEDCDVHNTSEVLFRSAPTRTRSGTAPSSRVHATHWTTRRRCRTSAATWVSTPRANCPAKGTRVIGPSWSAWTRIRRRGWTCCCGRRRHPPNEPPSEHWSQRTKQAFQTTLPVRPPTERLQIDAHGFLLVIVPERRF